MACFWVREYQKRIGIHFHVIFLFFGEQAVEPSEMRKTFSREVFSRWNKLHDGALVQQANMMTLQKKDSDGLRYLVKGISPTREPLPREVHWYGVRNRGLIKANSSPVPSSEVSKVYAQVFEYAGYFLSLPRDKEKVDDGDTL